MLCIDFFELRSNVYIAIHRAERSAELLVHPVIRILTEEDSGWRSYRSVPRNPISLSFIRVMRLVKITST